MIIDLTDDEQLAVIAAVTVAASLGAERPVALAQALRTFNSTAIAQSENAADRLADKLLVGKYTPPVLDEVFNGKES